MTQAVSGRAVVDTGVFGARFAPRDHSLEFAYRSVLAGRAVVISFITVAELRFDAALGGWGDRRRVQLERHLGGVKTVGPGRGLIAKYVELRRWCVQAGFRPSCSPCATM